MYLARSFPLIKPTSLALLSIQNRPDGKKHFELRCRYFTHGGKCFGEVITTTMIPEFFYGVMKITSLGVYQMKGLLGVEHSRLVT